MTKGQLITNAHNYKELLEETFGVLSREAPPDIVVTTKNDFSLGPRARVGVTRHAHWMCTSIITDLSCQRMISEKTRQKYTEWIGFVKGILWMTGTTSLKELKISNR